MKTIPVQNREFLVYVDDEDFERLSKFTWKDSGSNTITGSPNIGRATYLGDGKYKIIPISNEVMQKFDCLYDHKDKLSLNNSKDNLRECTQQQNNANRDKFINSTSRYKGVWRNSSGKGKPWIAGIRFNYKYYHLGRFNSEIEGAKAYDIKAKEFFGEFACLNFK